MQSTSAPPVDSQLSVDIQELITFNRPKALHLFLYSRSTANIPLFLLYKSTESTTFSHFSGEFTKQDSNIFVAIAREFITKTGGLLYTENLKFFLAENAKSFALEDIVLEAGLRSIVRARIGFTPPSNDICQLLCETPYIFQDSEQNMAFFVEVPMLDLEVVNGIAEKRELAYEMSYFSFDEVLDTMNQKISKELKEALTNQKLMAYTKKFIVNNEPVEIREHYAVINCNAKLTNAAIPSLHYSVHRKHGEKWHFYKAYDGEFPTDEELKTFKGVLIPGSGYSAYDTGITWYKGLFKCINKIVYEHTHINLLCICFGAQIVAQALGGRVEKMTIPFIRGGEVLTTQPTFYELDYIKKLGLDSSKPLVIGESHGDHIVELPPGGILQSSSVNANVEIYTIGNNVLSLQGHPEFSEAWTAGANYRVKGLNEVDYDRYAEEYIQEKFPSPCTQVEILKLCYHFLKKESKVLIEEKLSSL